MLPSPTPTLFRITNGTKASTLIVYAKTAPELEDKGITAFIIEKGMRVSKRKARRMEP